MTRNGDGRLVSLSDHSALDVEFAVKKVHERVVVPEYGNNGTTTYLSNQIPRQRRQRRWRRLRPNNLRRTMAQWADRRRRRKEEAAIARRRPVLSLL